MQLVSLWLFFLFDAICSIVVYAFFLCDRFERKKFKNYAKKAGIASATAVDANLAT